MSLDFVYQAIIPGLPDDLALRCLAKLSHGYHGLVEYNQTNIQWNAFDPEADRWHPLPRIPSATCGYAHFGFSCVTIRNRFLVIGGHFCPNDTFIPPQENSSPTNDVMQFDPFRKQWSRLASMQTKRSDFACAVVCDKVYVAGGWNSSSRRLDSAEVYDPLQDKWDDLPRLPILLRDCFGVSYDGKFHVFKRKGYPSHQNLCLVFNPIDKMWHPVKDICLNVRLMNVITTTVGDHFYTITESDGNIVCARYKDQQDWQALGRVPPVVLPNHSRLLESFSFGFTALGRDLYVVGGKVIKWNEFIRTFDIVQLDLVRVCDVTVLPLRWRKTRPMHGTCGAVVACGCLKE
ncbi:hypothetical protein MRB53_028897 [Persea americana]|uniref:Uncharacterized protein n=1 Tax=Persea americana TaxID=3435 RepID=A0ACC2KHJ5_PERAE|nr:hypothetical protein MRB53_028897 [Persea americana]